MFARSALILAPVVVAAILAGCGGGSNGATSASPLPLIANSHELRLLAGGGPPPSMDSGAIAGKLDSLKNRAVGSPLTGTLLLTVFQEPAGHVDVPLNPINCRSTVCIVPDGKVRLADFEFSAAEFQAVMTRNGIPVMYFQNREFGGIGPAFRRGGSASGPPDEYNEVPDTIGYGGWLEHSAFGTLAGPFHTTAREDSFAVAALAAFYSGALGVGEYVPRSGAFSFGNRTEETFEETSGSAAWTGVMTGIDTVFDHSIQGDAELVVDFSRRDVDVRFSEIFDLETGTKLTRSPLLPETSPSEALEIEFLDIPLTPDEPLTGANGFGLTDVEGEWSVEGWFYGPHHAEAGGVFQHLEHEMVGAFGVRRAQQ